ncbi:MAG: hypothetical protein AAFN78_05290 [Pseudomonadota bacterium]
MPASAQGRYGAALAALCALFSTGARCGDAPGLAPSLPPYLDGGIQLVLSNDFLGRGGSVDDFRTQQITLAADLSPEWSVLVDHSILTIDSTSAVGRVDQLSASLGRKLFSRKGSGFVDRIVAGVGVRGTGDFDGERMQNGFHRLVGSDIDSLPYTGEERTDLTAWFDGNHYRTIHEFSSWHAGYWLRAASLVTSDGQWDNTAAAYAVMSRHSLDVWLGVRGDWRSGYDRFVTRETAAAEQDGALVLGARFGPVVLETVQQFSNDASFGQVRFVSGVAGEADGAPAAFSAVELNVLLPSVQLRAATRWRLSRDNAEAGWQPSLTLGASYGEPQYRDDTNLFIRSRQVDLGLEFERPLTSASDSLSAFVSVGAGYRDERAESEATPVTSEEGSPAVSATVARPVATLGAGLRVLAGRPGSNWRFRLQLGALSRLPLDDAQVQAGFTTLTMQRPGIDAALGFSFDYR